MFHQEWAADRRKSYNGLNIGFKFSGFCIKCHWLLTRSPDDLQTGLHIDSVFQVQSYLLTLFSNNVSDLHLQLSHLMLAVFNMVLMTSEGLNRWEWERPPQLKRCNIKTERHGAAAETISSPMSFRDRWTNQLKHDKTTRPEICPFSL